MHLVKARKRHRCDECGRAIEIGERYWQSHETHGDAANKKEHVNCALAEAEKAEVLPLGFNANRSKLK